MKTPFLRWLLLTLVVVVVGVPAARMPFVILHSCDTYEIDCV
jgi:hypothetical protein